MPCINVWHYLYLPSPTFLTSVTALLSSSPPKQVLVGDVVVCRVRKNVLVGTMALHVTGSVHQIQMIEQAIMRETQHNIPTSASPKVLGLPSSA